MANNGLNRSDYDLINMLGQGMQRSLSQQELTEIQYRQHKEAVMQKKQMLERYATTSTSNSNSFQISGGGIGIDPVPEQNTNAKHLNPKLLLTRKA